MDEPIGEVPVYRDAYHCPDWPEFYDLWVEALFRGDISSEVPLIAGLLHGVIDEVSDREECAAKDGSIPINILDVGSGSGRVLVELVEHWWGEGGEGRYLDEEELHFRIIALEPSKAMMGRAYDRVRKCVEHARLVSQASISTSFVLGCATQLVGKDIEPSTIDLATFAVGSICHLSKPGEVDGFLNQLRQVLKKGTGRAAISHLRVLLTEADESTQEDEQEGISHIARLPSEDRPGEEYVRYPIKGVWDGSVRTDSFLLQVENAEGVVIRSQALEWKMKLTRLREWESAVEKNGLVTVERVTGDPWQWWWILKRAD
ncbi:hypothetical protein K402DRAFT_451981 [Aulographum hederae CBS 113979]|uniref:Methyltransferase domain-containing protein n=1 Tax=Aulographum hederae CBS 113979 TaxID=1176131 RepID=A0A6G1H9T1_9PEZI|nr:hypothetical protein K402DRAFT_451981 [Aulographum hederae CBS 113979]